MATIATVAATRIVRKRAKKKEREERAAPGRELKAMVTTTTTVSPLTVISSSSASSPQRKGEEDPERFTGEWWLDTDKANRYPLASHRAFLKSQRQKVLKRNEAKRQEEEKVRQRQVLVKMRRSFELLDLDGSGTRSKSHMV